MASKRKVEIEFTTDSEQTVLENLLSDIDDLIRERINALPKIKVKGKWNTGFGKPNWGRE